MMFPERRFGLVGRRLGHSFSANYFNSKFQNLGLPYRYDLFEFEQVGEVRTALRRIPGLTGLNVTLPYKEAIIPFLDSLDARAEAIGAVNTIRVQEGHWRGYNTDAEGFYQTLVEVYGTSFPDTAIVLGNGGAARAVIFVLREAGVHTVVYARNPGPGQEHFDAVTPSLVRNVPLVVQTTPVGMYPDLTGSLPFPFESMGKHQTLIDLVYNPEVTACMQIAARGGARTLNGLRMLYGQAEAAWRIWNP